MVRKMYFEMALVSVGWIVGVASFVFIAKKRGLCLVSKAKWIEMKKEVDW